MSAQTLVLDVSFTPIARVSWQHAITLFFKGSCRIIESYEDEIHSVTMAIKIPAVIQLTRHFNRRKAIKFSRGNIYMRDQCVCQYCGNKKSTRALTYDHVVPRVQGGKTTWTNIVTCCQKCNQTKAGRTPQQAKMKLLKAPEKPKWLPNEFLVAISRDSTIPDMWRSYIYWNVEIENENVD